MKKLLTLIVLVLTLTLVFASCGSNDQGSDNNSGGGNIDTGNNDTGNNDNENLETPCVHVWGEESLVVVEGKIVCVDGTTYEKTCTKCGEVASRTTDPAGHDYSDFVPVDETADNKYICVDGGTLVKHCAVCFDEQYTTVAAGEYPHTVYNWAITDVPTAEDKGILAGTCSVCTKDDITFEIPVLGSNAYKVEPIKEVACKEDGNYKYTYVNEDFNIDVYFEIIVAAIGHQLNGTNYEIYNINDGSYGLSFDDIVIPYWYGEANASGRLSAIGKVNPFNGMKFVCDSIQNGYFNCEKCQAVISVNVYYAHNGKTEIGLEPTCQSTGLLKMDCDNCAYDSLSEGSTDSPFVIGKVPHANICELVSANSQYVDSNGNAWELYDLVGTCIGNGCDCGIVSIIYDNIYNITKKYLTIPTCLSYGAVVYTFNQAGSDIEYSMFVNVPKTNHTLGGAPVKSYDDMTTDTYGIKSFVNGAFESVQCESMVDAYFVCEYCNGITSIKVKKVHTKTDFRVDVEPTCDNDGTKSYVCSNANCNSPAGTRFPELIPALGHSYEYRIMDHCITMTDKQIEEFIAANGCRYEIYKVCTRESGDAVCGAIDLNYGTNGYLHAVKLEKVDEVKATCYEEGYIVYRLDDEKVELKVVYPKINHTLAGLIVSSKEFNDKYVNPDNGAIYSTTPGIELFADANLVCDNIVEGYYECAVCKNAGVQDYLVTANIYKKHVNGEVITSPTCTANGTSYCVDCDAILELPELGHSYEYRITDYCMDMTTEQTKEFVAANGYRFEIYKVCTRESGDAECGAMDLDFGDNGYLREQTLKMLDKKDATCYKEGYVIYGIDIDDKQVELKVVYAKKNHTLGGLTVGSKEFNDKYVNPDNGAVYSTTPGVKLFGNSKPACETVVEGYYECEACKAAGVNANLNTIAVYKAHFVGEIITHATCTEEGAANCADCDAVLSLPELGHNYKYEVEDYCKNMTDEQIEEFIAENGYRYKISKVCIRNVDGVECGYIDLNFGQKGYMYTLSPDDIY